MTTGLRLIALLASLLSGCAVCDRFTDQPVFRGQSEPPVGTDGAGGDERTHRVYLVGHGWHTGIVIERDDANRDEWPEAQHFYESRYIEVGWGDEGFYQAERITPPLVAKAIFLPTPSVLHVAGFNQPPEEFFTASDVIEYSLSDDNFRRLCRFIHNTYELDADGEPDWLGPGLYGTSFFYRAVGSYYYPKTCNTWTARALRSAGVPVVPQLAATAGALLIQARPHGIRLSKSSPLALWYA